MFKTGFTLCIVYLVLVCSATSTKGVEPHKVMQLSSVPTHQGHQSLNIVPTSVWSDGTVYFTTVTPTDLANPIGTLQRQVMFGKVLVDDIAEVLLYATQNEFDQLRLTYKDASKPASPSKKCLAIFDSDLTMETCELNEGAAPKVFADLENKIHELIASAEEVKSFVPTQVYVRAVSIKDRKVTDKPVEMWKGPQLFVDGEKGVWLSGENAIKAWTAAQKATIIDYQGQHIRISAQVEGLSLIEPPKADMAKLLENESETPFSGMELALIFGCCFAGAWIFFAIVFVSVKAARKCYKKALAAEMGDVEKAHFIPLTPNQEEETPQPPQYYYMVPQGAMMMPNQVFNSNVQMVPYIQSVNQ